MGVDRDKVAVVHGLLRDKEQPRLAEAGAIALDEYVDGVADRQRILAFVEQQVASSSPRTRKAAQVFLKRHGR